MYDASPLLDLLFAKEHLSQAQSFALFNSIMHGEQPDLILATVLTALKLNGESPNEIAGAASAMVSNALPFPTPDYPFADIVGTGGDGHNTINISSAAGVVAASCGVKVAKHGNRSVSSKSGSADIFRVSFRGTEDSTPNELLACDIYSQIAIPLLGEPWALGEP